MKENTRISNLHCKFAEKSWNDTFQLVRRCMEISRDESKPCEPLVRSLERLQEEMGFHFADATCYLTADLFYLEVLLLPSGEVQEVKVATHGEHPVVSRPWPSGNMKQLLLFKVSTLFYFLAFEELLEFKPAVQAAQVTMGVSDLSHKLQMTSLISQPPQLDDHCPVFFPLGDVINEMLPACFLLRLKPPIPLLSSFIERVGQITDVPVPDLDLQWAPLPKLLLKGSASANGQSGPLEEQEIFRVVLPEGEIHTYILPEAAWDVPTQRAALLDGVPFTHPAHVCAILELLRHQCAYNTLLNSCFTPLSTCPVRPESTTSISLNELPLSFLSPVLVNISNPRQITCKLFGAGLSDPALDEYTSTVLMSCMSIPATMRTLYSRLEEITTAPLSTSHSAATEAENDHLSPVMDTDELHDILNCDHFILVSESHSWPILRKS
uniref:Mediator of RNA polymerase II transcription subunit 1 n=1 Tax=Cyprinodon variegatus TaxID=28743 RepID=A0A3Q2E9X5_CYPVA